MQRDPEMRGVKTLRRAAMLGVTTALVATPSAFAAKADTLVYFAKGEQLTSAARTIIYKRAVPVGLARASLRFLNAGPTAKERKRGIYSGFTEPLVVSSVKVKSSGEAVVYVTKGVVPAATKAKLAVNNRLRLAQITFSLTEYPSIKTVTIVTSNKGRRVEFTKLTRAKFKLPTGKPPKIVLPPWKGPRPDDPKSIQSAMADLGFLPRSAVDGKIGYRTQQSLYAFQAWYGLARTGWVDAATLAKLRQLDAAPHFPRASRGGGKHAEVYRDKGVTLLVGADGKVVHAVHVSTGAGGLTNAGTFSIFRKERYSWSVPFSVYLPWASYFDGGRAFHEYPDVPPYPASHGCIRVSAPEAPEVYGFLDYGTTVYVF